MLKEEKIRENKRKSPSVSEILEEIPTDTSRCQKIITTQRRSIEIETQNSQHYQSCRMSESMQAIDFGNKKLKLTGERRGRDENEFQRFQNTRMARTMSGEGNRVHEDFNHQKIHRMSKKKLRTASKETQIVRGVA